MDKVIGEVGIGMAPGPYCLICIIGGQLAIEKNSILIVLLTILTTVIYCILTKSFLEVLRNNKRFLGLFVTFVLLATLIPYIISTLTSSDLVHVLANIAVGLNAIILVFIIVKFYTKEALIDLNWKVVK